jgi:pimeloyl-ACP methyl ester carboxylesterase
MAETAAPIADGLDTSKLRFVDVNGTRTRYYEDGAGEPLVLFHGGEYGHLYSLDSWSLVLPELARHFHVYAVDRLGAGHTGNPAPDDYRYAPLLRHTIGFLDALGIRGAHLAGHSRGGLLIAAVAFARPELARTLLIVNSGTLAPDDPRYPTTLYDEVERRTPPGPPTPQSVRIEPDLQAHSAAQITDDFVARLLAIAQTPAHAERLERMRALAKTQWFPTLQEQKDETLRQIEERGLPCRTLMTWSYNDRSAALPRGHQLFDRIAARTSDAEFHIFNRTGHYVMREQPAAFIRLVRGFCLG